MGKKHEFPLAKGELGFWGKAGTASRIIPAADLRFQKGGIGVYRTDYQIAGESDSIHMYPAMNIDREKKRIEL